MPGTDLKNFKNIVIWKIKAVISIIEHELSFKDDINYIWWVPLDGVERTDIHGVNRVLGKMKAVNAVIDSL